MATSKYTINDLEHLVDPQRFFRFNRQVIAELRAVDLTFLNAVLIEPNETFALMDFKIEDPYRRGRDLSKVLTEQQVIDDVKALYAFMRQTITTIPNAKLFEQAKFGSFLLRLGGQN